MVYHGLEEGFDGCGVRGLDGWVELVASLVEFVAADVEIWTVEHRA